MLRQKLHLAKSKSLLLRCSVEVILRAEAVETAQAGDRCDFVGTLIVVPDVGSMSLPGEQLMYSSIYSINQILFYYVPKS